jgi:hypothetical protein
MHPARHLQENDLTRGRMKKESQQAITAATCSRYTCYSAWASQIVWPASNDVTAATRRALA